MTSKRRFPILSRSADPEPPGGVYTIEVGPLTDPGFVRHLEHSSAALRPSLTVFTRQPPTWVTYVLRPLLQALLGPRPTKESIKDSERVQREIAMRIAAMVNAGISLEDATREAESAPVEFMGYYIRGDD